MIGSRRGPGGNGSSLCKLRILFHKVAAPNKITKAKRTVEIAIVSERDRAYDPRAYMEPPKIASTSTASVDAGP